MLIDAGECADGILAVVVREDQGFQIAKVGPTCVFT